MLTGSVAFGVATEKSDVDYFIPSTVADKFPPNDNESTEGASDCGEFRSIRESELNFIISKSADFDCRWMLAHEQCVQEKPNSKARRIAIFRHYLYGEPAPDCFITSKVNYVDN